MPLLSELNILPFINVSAALAPNKNIKEVVNAKSLFRDYGRGSIGFGLSL